MTEPRKLSEKIATGAALGQACLEPSCFDQQIQEGVQLIEQGHTAQAQDLFQNMAECAAANQNIRYELLARGLMNLSEGRILAAQSNLNAVYEHPYAQRLLKIISRYDQQEVHLQTLHLLAHLSAEESLKNPTNFSLLRLKSSLDAALQGKGDVQSLKEALSALPPELGERIWNSAKLENGTRAQNLFGLIESDLMPRHRVGSSLLIAKMFEKDPEHNLLARRYISRLEGIPQDPRWITVDFLDQGASYFAISLFALAAGRWASRGVWHFLTRGLEEISARRTLATISLSLAASTSTYFLSEKTLLEATDFDGKIWPASGSEFARELGADAIVMGLSNLMGGVFTWSTDRIFAPISSRIPRAWRYLAYTLRSPLRVSAWVFTSGFHGTVLYGTHRWQDNAGIAERFRKGKPLNLLPEEWVNIEYQGFEVMRAQQVLRQYRSDSSRQLEDMKGDKVYHQIHDLKRWIRHLNENNPHVEFEEKLLGLFWIARACGRLNESVQDHLLQWMQQGRFERMNDYFESHRMPLKVSHQGVLVLDKL